MTQTIRIGGASGYWGESMMATPQLLQVEGMDYLVYDFLTEITMSILARARASKPEMGYATDFISGVLKPNLREAHGEKQLIFVKQPPPNPRKRLFENHSAKVIEAVRIRFLLAVAV